MQVHHVFQVLRGVISGFYVLFPGSMLNHRPVCYKGMKMKLTGIVSCIAVDLFYLAFTASQIMQTAGGLEWQLVVQLW